MSRMDNKHVRLGNYYSREDSDSMDLLNENLDTNLIAGSETEIHSSHGRVSDSFRSLGRGKVLT